MTPEERELRGFYSLWFLTRRDRCSRQVFIDCNGLGPLDSESLSLQTRIVERSKRSTSKRHRTRFVQTDGQRLTSVLRFDAWTLESRLPLVNLEHRSTKLQQSYSHRVTCCIKWQVGSARNGSDCDRSRILSPHLGFNYMYILFTD